MKPCWKVWNRIKLSFKAVRLILPHYLRVNNKPTSDRIKAADALLEPEVLCIKCVKNSVPLHVRMLIILNIFIHKGCKLKHDAFFSCACCYFK